MARVDAVEVEVSSRIADWPELRTLKGRIPSYSRSERFVPEDAGALRRCVPPSAASAN